MEEAKKWFVGKPYIVNEQWLLEKRIKELEQENKKLKTIIESIMKKYNMKEIGMWDEIIMKRDE